MNHEIESLYRKHYAAGTAISPHLPRLRELAEGLDVAVEFGVKRGASSTALLLGAQRVISFDIARTPEAMALKAVAGDRWDYRIEDSCKASIPDADLLFVDSQHDYRQVCGELKHAGKIRRYIVGHDTVTFGSVGARGESGEYAWQYRRGQCVPPSAYGIRLAYDELMIRDPSWRIKAHYPDSHGLLVLERH